MAGFTRVNGIGHAHGTLYSTLQLKSFVLDCGATLATQGGIGGAIEALAQELSPVLFQSAGTAGAVYVVIDGHAQSAASMQVRVRNLGTVNGYDFSGATVAEGTAVVVS